MKIAKRIKDGWTKPQSNRHKYTCDDCGQQLHVAPDGKTIFCNNESDKHEV